MSCPYLPDPGLMSLPGVAAGLAWLGWPHACLAGTRSHASAGISWGWAGSGGGVSLCGVCQCYCTDFYVSVSCQAHYIAITHVCAGSLPLSGGSHVRPLSLSSDAIKD